MTDANGMRIVGLVKASLYTCTAFFIMKPVFDHRECPRNIKVLAECRK